MYTLLDPLDKWPICVNNFKIWYFINSNIKHCKVKSHFKLYAKMSTDLLLVSINKYFYIVYISYGILEGGKEKGGHCSTLKLTKYNQFVLFN